jgi:hypothetical protein
MKAESKKIGQEIDQVLEDKIESLRIKPPRAIRSHIRELKSQDKRKEAEAIYQEHVERKRPVRKAFEARRMLYRKIDELFDSEDEKKEIEKQIEIIWLMDASGFINDEERRENLIEIIENTKNSKFHSEINEIMIESRDRLQRLLN